MRNIKAVFSRLEKVSPVKMAFIGSLLLSLIAVLGVDIIGRDASLYIDTAQKINAYGVEEAAKYFDWPWFPILLAYSHSLIGLPYEGVAYVWCALFMAGTCALLVDVVRRRVPEAGYWACLVVLAMPAANQFRFDIIREFGFWFFCSLALWLALLWQASGGWIKAGVVHLAVLMAALFRLEALVLLPALFVWSLFEVRANDGGRRFLQLNALPFLLCILGVVLFLVVGGGASARVDYYLTLLNPRRVFSAFNVLSRQFSDSLIYDYSKGEAGRIIFFGMLSALLIKFVKILGPFSLPFLMRNSWLAGRFFLKEFRVFALVALFYFVVLMLFFVRQQFMISRYVCFLDLLVVPFLAVALMQWAKRFPSLAKILVVISLGMMLDNVIAWGAKKTQIVEAGAWVAQHVEPEASVFYFDARVAYYAGRGFPRGMVAQGALVQSEQAGKYSYYLVKANGDEPWLQDFLVRQKKKILARFSNRKSYTILVVGD